MFLIWVIFPAGILTADTKVLWIAESIPHQPHPQTMIYPKMKWFPPNWNLTVPTLRLVVFWSGLSVFSPILPSSKTRRPLNIYSKKIVSNMPLQIWQLWWLVSNIFKVFWWSCSQLLWFSAASPLVVDMGVHEAEETCSWELDLCQTDCSAGKGKDQDKKTGNEWTDLLVVNALAWLVYDLEGFQPPAFGSRVCRADSLLHLTLSDFPAACRVPAGVKGAQRLPQAITPDVPCARLARASTQGWEDRWYSSGTVQGRMENFCNAPQWILVSKLA